MVAGVARCPGRCALAGGVRVPGRRPRSSSAQVGGRGGCEVSTTAGAVDCSVVGVPRAMRAGSRPERARSGHGGSEKASCWCGCWASRSWASRLRWRLVSLRHRGEGGPRWAMRWVGQTWVCCGGDQLAEHHCRGPMSWQWTVVWPWPLAAASPALVV
jgi:hypothetical protein